MLSFVQVDFLCHKETKSLLKNRVKPVLMNRENPLSMCGVDALNCLQIWVQHLELIP